MGLFNKFFNKKEEALNIKHSKQLNDFLTFYIETRVNGILKYESIIDYLNGEYDIVNIDNAHSIKFKFDLNTEELALEKEIKSNVEKLIKESFDRK